MTTLAKKQPKDTAYYIKSAIGIFLMFGFGYLPPIAPQSHLGMQILGIFVGLIFLLCTVSIVWPSMLAVIALGMTEYCTVAEAVSSGFGSELVWMMLMMLILSEGMATSGMGEIIARWIITRKFLNKRPFLFTFVFMWGMGICSLLVGSIVVVLMSWSIFYSIAEIVGYKKGERYSTMMIIGCFLSAILFEGLLAFLNWLPAFCLTYQNMTGVGINYVTYFIIGFIVATLMIFLSVLAMKFIFKCDFSKLNNIDVEALKSEGIGRLNFRHKFYLVCFGLIVAYVILTTVLPADFFLTVLLNTVTQTGWFTIVLVVAVVIRHEGKPVLDFAEVAKTGANWNILMMCASVIPVARALTSDGTGVTELINNLLSPIFGSMGPVMFIITVMVAMMILTNIGSNMATSIIVVTVVLPFVSKYYFSPAIIGMAILLIANLGFIFPGSSGMAPFLYSNKWIEVKDIYKYGLVYCVIFLIAAIPTFVVASYII